MMPEPLKSALSLGDVEDTSLALPSDREMRSAQQRVLDQVHTVKRTKSKYGSKSFSGLPSPTSPESDSVFLDFKLTSSSSLSGPSINRGNTMTNGTKQRQNYMRKSMNSRHSSAASRKDQTQTIYVSTGPVPTQPRPNSLYSPKVTRSAPDLGLHTVANGGTAHRNQSVRQSLERVETHYYPLYNGNSQSHANGTYKKGVNRVTSNPSVRMPPVSLNSNGESKVSQVSQYKSGGAGYSVINTERLISDMTMAEAIELLRSPDENRQLCGAAYIQHSTFTDEKAKQEVLTLKGISPLLKLLNSPSPQIQETVAAALRNAVFKNQQNKDQVQVNGGITQVVQLLGETSDETQKHLTGLLWNLSSADNLKPELLKTALPALTEKIIEPFASNTGSTIVSPDVFYNATACLRNMSSPKLANRQAMRSCKGLIDSLMRYMENCINDETPDNPSLENCVCILHNLTYQLESEMSSVFLKINSLANQDRSRSSSIDASAIGCFSSQSQKLQQESYFDYPVMEERNPKGVNWLFHSKALQMYLKLLSTSEKDATLEACCGVLQNLTAKDGIVSDVLSHTIVHKLDGMKSIIPLLQSSNPALQDSAIALFGNLSKSSRTANKSMAQQSLPQLVRCLNSDLTKDDSSPNFDKTTATALYSAHTLFKADPEMGKNFVNNSLITSLRQMSLSMNLPKSSTAAGVLLHSLWSDKNTQSLLKKQGMDKKLFVNDVTSAAIKTLQVID
ncbi:plakophilin-1 [Misgurnus anguillicaudatus]|uniref:plakophilin-1 n=1 Tax=Misgurnus anguillicaudatus TaxID=75329 RepID=UPI003CCF0DB3